MLWESKISNMLKTKLIAIRLKDCQTVSLLDKKHYRNIAKYNGIVIFLSSTPTLYIPNL